jgi:hypothetical protein
MFHAFIIVKFIQIQRERAPRRTPTSSVLLKVQLIGYPVRKDEQFVVCEFSEKVHLKTIFAILNTKVF